MHELFLHAQITCRKETFLYDKSAIFLKLYISRLQEKSRFEFNLIL